MTIKSKQELTAEITRLWRHIRRTLEDKDPSPWLGLSLTKGQLRILFLLSSEPQMSPGAVAAALGVPKANVTDIIQRLVKQELVSRTENVSDRRSHTLRLTEKGRREVDRLREWNTRRLERATANIPEDELLLLAHSLEVMLAAAQQMKGSKDRD
jgi:DNA-binding MarR family transcriptional regulator